MNYNRTILLGYLTRDPELRHTQSGTALCKFGMAVNHKYKRADGETQESTCFVDCVAWGRTGEVIHQYLKKGNPIFLEGRLSYSSWDDKASGAKRSKLEVVVESFQFVGGKKEDSAGTEETPF